MIGKEKKKKLDINVSSTGLPSLQMNEDALTLAFSDWENQSVTIDFLSVLAFRWLDSKGGELEIDDDKAFEIVKSEWISELCEQNSVPRKDFSHYHHYQFITHNSCVFEVVCEDFDHSTIAQTKHKSLRQDWANDMV
jgi:hypothetical protein